MAAGDFLNGGTTLIVHSFIVNNRIADILNTDKPDERQIMTYVSCYYHAFQGAMQVGEQIVWVVPTLFTRLIVFESLKLQLISDVRTHFTVTLNRISTVPCFDLRRLKY